MAFDEHPYAGIYFLGCVAAVVFLAARYALFWALNWFTKLNIQSANLRKLKPDDRKPIGKRFSEGMRVVGWEMGLSWISVAHGLWQVFSDFLRFVREILSPVPEVVKKLRFPLRNNPGLSREAVWAHFLALTVIAGDQPPNEQRLISELSDAMENLPGFDALVALCYLEPLGVTKPDVLTEVRKALQKEHAGTTEAP